MDLITRAASAALAGALTTLSACASEVSPSAQIRGAEADAEPTAALPASSGQRCGWVHNPTPANWWLIDRDGEWILATQGGRQAPGMDSMPDMTTLGWVEVNGHYGYGCACMRLVTDPATREVARIDSAAPQPLEQCRADPDLPRP